MRWTDEELGWVGNAIKAMRFNVERSGDVEHAARLLAFEQRIGKEMEARADKRPTVESVVLQRWAMAPELPYIQFEMTPKAIGRALGISAKAAYGRMVRSDRLHKNTGVVRSDPAVWFVPKSNWIASLLLEHFDPFDGREVSPFCGHSACRQHWIDTGYGPCVQRTTLECWDCGEEYDDDEEDHTSCALWWWVEVGA